MKTKKIKLKRKKNPDAVLKEFRKKRKVKAKPKRSTGAQKKTSGVRTNTRSKTASLKMNQTFIWESWALNDQQTLETNLKLRLGCASLNITLDDWVEFAPLHGTNGVIKMWGVTAPTFQYTVFERSIMCFVQVTVVVGKPDKFHYRAQIQSPEDALTDGQPIAVKNEYKLPFLRLAYNLARYFPFARTDVRQDQTFNLQRGKEWGPRGFDVTVSTWTPTKETLKAYAEDRYRHLKKEALNGIHHPAPEKQEEQTLIYSEPTPGPV